MTTGEGLVVCPRCDALFIEVELEDGETARCTRCETVIARPRTGAFSQIIALSFTTMVLMVGAVFFPFLEISRMGFGNATSIFGVVLAYADGVLLPLVLGMVAMVVALPVIRASLLLYVLLPLAKGQAPHRHAAGAFRLSEQMRPWSMAEIFIIGTSVALVKVAGLATIHLGPAFWAFCALILVNVTAKGYMCQTTIWDAIEDGGASTDGRELVDGLRNANHDVLAADRP
ncbi:paraquat-inducible protein A (plasmid) [Paracoccus sp. TK19116]|uniref:Paraquat-inducible protein A n=2 Tax=Paracoccus albicereus TaxID=2922394 RepID=A0ABT1MM29_9RHOB|nr:paraquat-inducible protein A [Paracoccus albicereus]